MLLLTHLQRGASYPFRIAASLILNICAFSLLALSTIFFRSVSPGLYFAFLMCIVLASALAAALCQNGVFAYVTNFGKGEYTQGIMTGQAIAGVLPCVAQIVSVLSVAESDAGTSSGQESPKSAFAYFLTATGVSILALGAIMILVKRHGEGKKLVVEEGEDGENTTRKVLSLRTLFRKLHWLALAVFICFAVTMIFPVFTQEIFSVQPPSQAARLLQPACFIPLAFLFWNTGDLMGRLLTLIPPLAAMVTHPRPLVFLTLARFSFIPLYQLCNVHGRGAVIPSDVFYLLVVQFLFGLSNGYVGSICMMGPVHWVEPEEREAAGSFMGLMLCGGLTTGSLLSFLIP
ncbi:hypothetical protein MMC07_003778 [Pseudocyphellaria aurata]|nr:hypothetical protein [Pseudocyphellaria aurata]